MKKLLLLTIAALSTAAAHAAVITETVNFGSVTGDKTLSFSQFDTSLGTLTGVTLSWTINSSISTASITNQNAGTVTVTRVSFTNTVEGSIFDDQVLTAEVVKSRSHTPSGGTVTLTPGQSYGINNVAFSEFTQEDNYTSGDANFDRFKGTGDVPIYLANTFGATPTVSGGGSSTTAWLTSITGSSTGTLEVTYNYIGAIAPVPEPSAMILGGGGLLFLGAFAFKKRKPVLNEVAA